MAEPWETLPDIQGDSWETLPDVQPATPAPVAQAAGWEDLPDLELDTGGGTVGPTPNMSVGQPFTAGPTEYNLGQHEQGFIKTPDLGPYANDPKAFQLRVKQGEQRAQQKAAWDTGWAAIEGFRKEHITPIVKLGQEMWRTAYFGDDPELAKSGIKPQLTGIGGKIRESNPALAMNIENLARIPLGETELNQGGSTTGVFSSGEGNESPLYAEALAQAEQGLGRTFGPIYSAASQAFSSGYANLPFFLIPGVGQSGFAQGVTGGAFSAIADPEQDLQASILGGGGAGHVIGKAIKGVAKWRAGKAAQKEMLPLAVLRAQDEPALAEAIFSMPEGNVDDTFLRGAPEVEPVIPSKSGVTGGASPRAKARQAARPEPVAVAIDTEGGLPVGKALSIGPDGIHSSQPPAKFKGKIVATQRAINEAVENPTGAVAKAINGEWSPGMWIVAERAGDNPRLSPDEIPSQIADGYKLRDDVREGSVLVLEGGGGAGTARLYDVNDPKLQREILRQRKLAEVTMPDGSVQRGYLSHGSGDTEILLPPEADELIPGATVDGVDLAGVDSSKVRVLGGKEIDMVLIDRELAKSRQELDAVIQAADQNAEAADIAAGGNGNGDNLPPAPPMDPPPPPPPFPHNVDGLEEMRGRYWQQIYATLGRKVGRKVLAPTVYGPRDLADKAMSAFSINTFERLRDDTLKALVKSTPLLGKATPAKQRAVQEALSSYLTGGGVTYKKLTELHPEVSAKGYELVQKYKDRIHRNEQALRDLGMLMPEENLAKLMKLPKDADLPDYATRMYYRFLMKPGEWKRLIYKDKAKVERLVGEIRKDVFGADKYLTWSDASKDVEARKYFDLIVGDPERLSEAGIENSKLGTYLADGQQSLKARKELPAWQREALGEVDNAFVRIAESVTRQEQLVLQGEMWKSVASNRQLSTFGDMADQAAAVGHTMQLPMDAGKFGKAAGLRVSPDTYYALVEAPRAQRNASTVVSRFVNALKYGQTVANPGSWVTNFFANAQGAMLSNLVDPFTAPASVGHGMLTFAKDLAEHSAAPGLRDTAGRQRFMRAMEIGVVGSEYSTAEFRKSASEFGKAMQKHADANSSKVLDVLQWFPDQLRSGKDKLASYYSSIDSFWKYSTYVSGLRKGGIGTDGYMDAKKAIEFIGDRYRKGMSLSALREQVELEVARRIHFSFPMMDRVGEIPAAAGKFAGVVNPYIKVKSELIRNYAQLPSRIMNEKGMRANMMKTALVAGGAIYAMRGMREANGINQEEVDNAFATAPRAFQRFKPGATALWYRQEDGQLATADLTQMFEPLTWLQGDPNASMTTKFMTSMALNGVDGSLAEGPTVDLLATSGMIPPSFHNRPMPEWQRSGSSLLAEGIGKLGPGVIRNTYNTITKTEGAGFAPPRVRGPTVPQLPPAVGATNLLAGPGRITPIGSPEQATREIQALARDIEQAKRELADVGVMREGQSSGMLTGPLDKADAMRRARAVLDQKIARMKQLQNQLRSTP